MTEYWPCLLAAVCAIAVLRCAARQRHGMRSLLAGAVCGDHISPISDTTVMSSAGAQSNHINHVTTQMQYAAVVAVVCIIGYIIAGLVQIWWVALGISLMLLLAVLTFIKKRSGSNREKTAGI